LSERTEICRSCPAKQGRRGTAQTAARLLSAAARLRLEILRGWSSLEARHCLLEVVSSNLTPREPHLSWGRRREAISSQAIIHAWAHDGTCRSPQWFTQRVRTLMKPHHRCVEAFNADLESDVCRSFSLDPSSEGFQSGVVFLLIELWKDATAAQPAPADWLRSRRQALFEVFSTCHTLDRAASELAIAFDTVDLVTTSAFGRLMAERRHVRPTGA